MKKIDELKRDYDIKRKEVYSIREAIEEIELKKVLPDLKKKYEGKFFKYKNRMSGEKWWWLYIYCREVESENWGVVDRFQTTPYQSDFNLNHKDILSTCEIEITREEYKEELDKFINKLSELKRIY